MPQSKEELRKRGHILMTLAKKYRAAHPNVEWRHCVAEAGKLYRQMKK
jgi:hypothetical protein